MLASHSARGCGQRMVILHEGCIHPQARIAPLAVGSREKTTVIAMAARGDYN